MMNFRWLVWILRLMSGLQPKLLNAKKHRLRLRLGAWQKKCSMPRDYPTAPSYNKYFVLTLQIIEIYTA